MTTGDDATTPDSVPPSLDGLPSAIGGSLDRADYQRLWLGTQSRPWKTLAVVPVDDGMSTHEVASLITALGLHHGATISVADLREVRLSRVGAFLEAAGELVKRGQRVVYSTCSIKENLATVPLARAADAVILCVSMGTTLLGSIGDVVEQIGKERVLGSVLIKSPDAVVRAPSRASRALLQLQARS